MKLRNSFWLVLALGALVALLIGALVGSVRDTLGLQDQVDELQQQNWDQKSTSDEDLAHCQEAVTGALQAVQGAPDAPSEYTVTAAAQDCLSR